MGPKDSKGPKRYLWKLKEYEELFVVGLETSSLYLKDICTQVETFSGVHVQGFIEGGHWDFHPPRSPPGFEEIFHS